jgi:hypothetical protein
MLPGGIGERTDFLLSTGSASMEAGFGGIIFAPIEGVRFRHYT